MNQPKTVIMKTTMIMLALISFECGAQQTDKGINAFYYQVDESNVYSIRDGVPGSVAAFYSERHGGKLLSAEVLNEEGKLNVIASKNFKPAFVLSTRNDATGVAGTGKVFFMEEKEFTIANMKVERSGLVTVSWNAAIDPAKDIVFEIHKSKDGVTYEFASSVTANKSALLFPYSFHDKAEEVISYKIRVVNAKEGARYTSYPLGLSNNNYVTVYPSVVTSEINIELLQNVTNTEYSIMNIAGQKMKQGKLITGQNKIGTSELASGVYIINVSGKGINQTERIIKQ